MRTHSGERPFQCDICLRKFTLKHSMLRHRKKHSGAQSINPMHFQLKSPNSEQNGNSGNMNQSCSSDMSDDEQLTLNSNHKKLLKMMPDMIPINFLSQINQHLINNQINNNDKNNNENHENQSNNVEDKPNIAANMAAAAALLEKLSSFQQQIREAAADGEGSLIGNLLGISDQGILNKIMSSSVDEASKLLGINK